MDAENEDNISEGIVKVLSDTHMQEEMSLKGLAQSKKFTWENTAQATINVYEAVNS